MVQVSDLSRQDLLLAMLGIGSATVLVALDSTVVGTTLPQAAAQLEGMALYAWVGSLYMLLTAIAIPIFGRLGDLFGRKPLILTSLAIIIVGALGCAVAINMPMLIAARTVQALGAGMLIATAFAAPADLFPDPLRRVKWQAIISTSFALGSGIGPVLGGFLTQTVGWRSSFLVVPFMGVVAALMIWRFYPRLEPVRQGPVRLDYAGGALLILGVGLPILSLELASLRWLSWPLAAALIAVGATCLWFLSRPRVAVVQPMFPPTVLETRQARQLSLVAVFVGAVMFMLIFYSPLLLQTAYGASPKEAGLLLTPLVLGIPVGSLINGRIFPRINQPQRLMVLGSLLLGIGCAGVLSLDSGVSTQWAMLAFACCGLGLGFLLPNLTIFMQMTARRENVGMASAMIQTTRSFGSAVAVALVGQAILLTSIHDGIRIGLGAALFCCLIIGVLGAQVQMRNLILQRMATTRAASASQNQAPRGTEGAAPQDQAPQIFGAPGAAPFETRDVTADSDLDAASTSKSKGARP